MSPRTRTRLAGSAGTSLVELMVVISLLAIILAVVHGSVIAQVRAYANQSLIAESRFAARSALRVLADQVGMAGFGVPVAKLPSVAPSIVTAEASRISFWSDTHGDHTYLSAAVLRNATTITVLSTAGLKVGSSLYISDSSDWYFGSVQTVTGTTVRVTPALTYNFAAGSFVTPIEQVTFELSNQALLRNGHTFIQNVNALQFTYDSAKVDAIRSINIRLDVNTRASDPNTGQRQVISVNTQVSPSNLAL